MFSWFKKEKWKLVKTITEDVTLTCDDDKTHGKAYFMLFESDRGNRRSEIKTNLRCDQAELEAYKLRADMYLEKIYRWEQGRPDPEIPTYNTVDEEDTVNALKGTI